MKQTISLSGLLLILFFSTAGLTEKNKLVTIEINYGEQNDAQRIQVKYTENMTALEALMHAADVKTHPVGQYVFVSGINGVEGIRGEMAWYYTLNGKKPKLAIHQRIKAGDTISWQYVKDICSGTLDGPKKD